MASDTDIRRTRRKPSALRRIASSAVGVVVAGCSAAPTALYPGPARDRSEIAVIRRSGTADLRVLGIDDVGTRGYEWHVEPGPHRIWVELVQHGTAMNVNFKGWTYCSIDFEADAGGDYRVVSASDQSPAGGGDTAVTLGMQIVDASGQPVAVSSSCSGRRPQIGG